MHLLMHSVQAIGVTFDILKPRGEKASVKKQCVTSRRVLPSVDISQNRIGALPETKLFSPLFMMMDIFFEMICNCMEQIQADTTTVQDNLFRV